MNKGYATVRPGRYRFTCESIGRIIRRDSSLEFDVCLLLESDRLFPILREQPKPIHLARHDGVDFYVTDSLVRIGDQTVAMECKEASLGDRASTRIGRAR